MYRTLAEQLEEVRNRYVEPSAASVSDRDIISLLNQGAYVCTRDLGIYFQDIYAFATVAKQQEYNLPEGFTTASNLIYSPWIQHRPIQMLEFEQLTNQFPQNGDPNFYSVDVANRKIFLEPIPSSSAQTTTLNGSLSATAVSIMVLDTTGFGAMGRVIIDTETIQYTGITATTITGCTRGVDGTSAATHSTAATVTWCNFYLYYQRVPSLLKTSYATGTMSVSNAGSVVTGVAVTWLNGQNIYSGNYIGVGAYKSNNASETFPLKWYEIASVDNTTQLTLKSVFAEPTVATGVYIITDKSELLDAETELPVLFAEIMLYRRFGNKVKEDSTREVYAYEMSQAIRRMNPPDYIPTVRKTKEANDYSNPIPRFPSYYPSIGGM